MGLDTTETQFDLAHYVDVVRRRRALLLLAPLLCTVGAYFLSARGDDMYRATAQLRVDSEQIDTEVELATTNAVRSEVEDRLGEDANLIESVTVQRIGETQLVSVSVTSEEPSVAAEAANVWADVFVKVRNTDVSAPLREESTLVEGDAAALTPRIVDVQTQINQLETALAEARDSGSVDETPLIAQLTELRTELARLEAQQRDLNDRATALESEIFRLSRTVALTDPANVPRSPFAPKPVRAALTGLFAGILLGGVAAGIAEVVDDPIWDATDAQRWVGSLPVLAAIPPMPKRHTPGLPLTLEEPKHAVSEAFRILRTSLQFLALGHDTHRIMVTSADVGDGKTTTAVNLAVALARGGSSVVVVDGDLRRSSVHHEFGLSNSTGVTSVLVGERSLERSLGVVSSLESGVLRVLAAGPTPPNPAELISSPEMAELLEHLSDGFDAVIVDTPPLLAVSDPLAMAKHVDGAILVVRVRHTRGRALANAVERIRQSGVPLLGVVLNDDPEKANAYTTTSTNRGLRLPSLRRRGRTGTDDADYDDWV